MNRPDCPGSGSLAPVTKLRDHYRRLLGICPTCGRAAPFKKRARIIAGQRRIINHTDGGHLFLKA